MTTLAQDLASIPAFRTIPPSDLVAVAPWWLQRDLDPGAALWEEGEVADGLAVLVRGEMSVESDGVPLGRIRAGEVLGEASAVLAVHTRTATLRAITRCRVLAIDGHQLQSMRAARGPVYEALLDLAEHALLRRIHEADLRVAQTAFGNGAAPARERRSALVRVWNALRPGLPDAPCPPIEPLLWVQPALGSVPAASIAAIARGFTPEAVAAGHVLFLEGEPGTAAWLIAAGEVDVWRNVSGGQAERLATLGPGRLLGVNALIERGPRAASCVTTTPCWLYRMDGPAGYRHLRGRARQAWRESLLGSLTAQIRTVDEVIGTTVREREAASVPRLGEILRGSGFHPEIAEADLVALDPMVSPDEERELSRYSNRGEPPSVL